MTAGAGRSPLARQTFPGELDSLSAIRTVVRDAAAQAGLAQERTYKLELAVDEIATNIVVHGYEEAGLTGEVGLVAEVRDDALEITLEDTAAPFDPTKAELPTEEDLAAPLSERHAGGLGVLLARTVDVFRYERAGGRNRTTLGMRR